MEMESMFTEQKWNILKALSAKKQSPIQLAETLKTSMANVSQQLRLLEASQLVKKEKISNRDKGKPRTLYSLTEDYAYLIATMEHFAKKKLLKVNDHHRIILRIWFMKDPELRYQVEQVYWNIESHLDAVKSIIVNTESLQIFLVTDNSAKVRKLIAPHSKQVCKILDTKQAKKTFDEGKPPFDNAYALYPIFDPAQLFTLLEKKEVINA